MKKILFVCAGNDFPRSAMNFLQYWPGENSISVTGLFFSTVDLTLLASASFIPGTATYDRLAFRERAQVEQNVKTFSDTCNRQHIRFTIHPNKGEWDKNLLARESRFADLLVIGEQNFFSDIDDRQPNLFLQEALHAAECPVMLLPENYIEPQRLVIAYDGSKDSLYAIRQFCYLMPGYTDLPAEVIYIRDEATEDIPDLEILRHYMRAHFQGLSFSKLHFRAAHYFATWIAERENTLLVAGSFGRPAFSYVTKKSFVEKVIQEHSMPVFIAHS